jgi:hypothetical protein
VRWRLCRGPASAALGTDALCRESMSVPRGGSVQSRHSTAVPRVFSVPRVRPFALGKAPLCRELWIWLSAQNRALGRGYVSSSVTPATWTTDRQAPATARYTTSVRNRAGRGGGQPVSFRDASGGDIPLRLLDYLMGSV